MFAWPIKTLLLAIALASDPAPKKEVEKTPTPPAEAGAATKATDKTKEVQKNTPKKAKKKGTADSKKAQKPPKNKPKKTALSSEDREIIQHLDLLLMFELLSDYDLFEEDPK